MTETRRPCPYCAEDIAPEAVRCPHCRSRLVVLDPSAWHRDHPERRVAGVAAALGRALAVPVAFVRAAFVVLTFFHLVGVLAYVALWAVIPARPGEPAPYERLLARLRSEWVRLRGDRQGPGAGGAAGHVDAAGAAPGATADPTTDATLTAADPPARPHATRPAA